MLNDNSQKKRQIDDVLARYDTRMTLLKQKRDEIVSDFVRILSEKRIAELRKQLGIT